MKKESIENLKIKDLKHVLTPLKRGRMLKNYIDVGWDSEYTSEDNSSERTLLSMQFSLGKGKSRIYYVKKREGVSSEELLDYVLKFLDEQGAEPKKAIYLISYLAQAELSKIKDFYEEFQGEEGWLIRPEVHEFNKAISWEKKFYGLTLHVVDLFGHMKAGLADIGESMKLGLQKLDLNADGKGYDYWIVRMDELLEKHRDLYEAYAIRDAEIAVEAFKRLEDEYQPANLDPKLTSTYTALAVDGFRRIMSVLPCKTREEIILKPKKTEKTSEYKEYAGEQVVYGDDFNVRILAAQAYWGGNNQAFVRGYYPDIQGTYYDFISLYIAAAILQPLSNAYTDYKRMSMRDVKDGAEGFADVEFEFPEGEPYPSLPMRADYFDKLMFVLKGQSYCTFTELREALNSNVKIKSFYGFGFYPDRNEIEHELRPYLMNMLKKKSDYDQTPEGKHSIEREFEKAKMVGIIGRFAYMHAGRVVQDVTRLMHESALKFEEFRRYGRKKALREWTTRSEVGGTWHIEWASLILGKARAMAAWAIRQGEQCLSISTDGGFWLGNPHFENSEIHKLLTTFRSGISFEGKFDELFIPRNRVYVAWDGEKVLRSAMMGVAVPGMKHKDKEKEFQNMVRKSLDAKQALYKEAETQNLSGLNDFIFNGIPLNSVLRKKKRINWGCDGKRKPEKVVNPFVENTDTKPWENIITAFRVVKGIKEVGRPRKLSEEVIQKIREEPLGMTVRELAKKYTEYGATINTVQKIRKEVHVV